MVVKIKQPSDTCLQVGVPLSSWSAPCPNCWHEVRVDLSVGKPAPPTPLSQRLSINPVQQYWAPQTLQKPTSIISSPYAEEVKRVRDTLTALRLSGWYYGNLDWQGARNLLKEASVGAFVIRNSGDNNYIFSLSVQTERGPTSVRLIYEELYFRLDCDRPLKKYMPRFQCVVELVQHYARVGQRGALGTVWVDREGCPHSPVLLKNPLKKNPPSLLHCARLAVHKALDSNPVMPKIRCAPTYKRLPLPSSLIDYLGEYPYSI